MKVIVALIIIGASSGIIGLHTRLNAMDERIKFICSLPIVTNKSVLLLQEREGKWVLDNDMQKSFYYVPSGCN